MYNVVSTLAPWFLIGSYSFLHVTRTVIKAWTGLKFCKISSPTELAALERSKNECIMLEHSSTFVFDWILFTFAGNKDSYKSLDGFEIQQEGT